MLLRLKAGQHYKSYSKRIAFVGSMREMSIDGSTSIATDSRNITMFKGMSHQENSMGTLSM